MVAEFSGIRSAYFKEILRVFPDAREEELELALQYLQPKQNETILEVGAGSGFFTGAIAERIFPSTLIASDPSVEQLEEMPHLTAKNIRVVEAGGDNLPLEHPLLSASGFDAIWSGGSFHHIRDKTSAFKRFFSLLKNGGRLVISDVFAGSSLAKHFDLEVAKYSATGHEVSFLTREFADSLCHLAGFQTPIFYDAPICWKFKKKEDIGTFLYKIHAMIKTTAQGCLENAEKYLGINRKNGLYCLNWPLTILIAHKR
jgi:arsenite methyltransferase